MLYKRKLMLETLGLGSQEPAMIYYNAGDVGIG